MNARAPRPEGLPETMRAIEIARPGGPEVLRPCTRPLPLPGPHEVLIRVHHAGVNRPDALQRAGLYAPPPGASDLPGLEVAGEVAMAGAAVHHLAPGDRICALVPGGGYAEYAVCPAAHALPVPRGLSLRQAACLPETFFTVWSTVFQRGALRAGERFLVHGGASGIGTTAIQMANVLGARVFATAGSDEKCAACIALGAEMAVNYREGDFVEMMKAAGGADLILDMVGGPYIGRNLKALAEDGRLVQIAFLEGAKAEISFAPLMLRRQTITGATLRPQSDIAKARIADQLRAVIWPLLETGRIAPVLDSAFPLERAARAHERLEGPDHVGKIVLDVL